MSDSETVFVRQYEPGIQARVELRNGRIVDVFNGRYYDEGTGIILHGGKIESVGSRRGLTGEPTGVTPDYRIDLQGKSVLPSLFNTHIHGPQSLPTFVPGLRDMLRPKGHNKRQLAKDLAECLAHGVTNVRHAGYVADLHEIRMLQERIRTGELPGPRILQAVVVGPEGSYMQEKLSAWMKILGGMPQVDPSQDCAGAVAFPINATESQVRDAVDIAIDERGADVIKIGDESLSMIGGKPVPMMSLEQLSVLADQARRRGMQSTMHHTSVESFRRGVRVGVSSLAHVPWDTSLTREDVDAFKASGCVNDPTISVFYALFSWNLAGDHSTVHPELNRLTAFRDRTYPFATIADEYYIPELRASVMNGYKACASGKPRMMGIIDMSGMYGWDTKTATGFENFCLLYKHGIPMSTGNDTKPPLTPAMIELELRMFDHVLKGDTDGVRFSGADAVKIATIHSARSLGLEEEFGSIEAGKTADLAILEGEPLEDFRLIGSRVAALFMDGKLVINNCGLQVESNDRVQA